MKKHCFAHSQSICELYPSSSSFDFEYDVSSDYWEGPCIILKATVEYKARDLKCDKLNSYICRWTGKCKQKHFFST